MHDDDPDAVITRWSAYAGEGLVDEAEELVRGALRQWPDDARFHYLLGSTIVAQPESEDEVRDLAHETARLGATDPESLMCAARLLMAIRDLDDAGRYVERALNVAADDEDFIFEADLLNTAGAILSLLERDAQRAERMLRRAFEMEPGEVGHGRDLAAHLAGGGRLVEALEVVSQALEHRPDDELLIELRKQILEYLRE